MATTLILFKPELNPDVYFEDDSKWTIGTDWVLNSPGAAKPNGNTSQLQLLLSGLDLRATKTYKYKIRVESNVNNAGGDYCQLVIGTNVFTIPASGTPEIYEGFLQLDTAAIYFESTSGNAVTISYLNLTEYPSDYEIDLTEDIDVPLNYAVGDVKDPSKRDGAFSRTVTIPATKNNSKFFNHVYEISAECLFNVNKKVRASIVNDGIEQFNGFCKLDKINRIQNGVNNYSAVSYDITLLGDLADLFYQLGDTLLSDLDFSEYDHAYTRLNQRNSWYMEIVKNGAPYSNTLNGAYLTITSCQNSSGRVQVNFSGSHGLVAGDWILIPEESIPGGSGLIKFYAGEHMVYSVTSSSAVVLQCPYLPAAGTGLATNSSGTDRVRKHTKKGEGYVYPMIDYDQNDNSNWDTTQFYPGIYAREILDKIMKWLKYQYSGGVINQTMFKKAIIPCNGGTLKLSNEEIANRLFRAGNSADQFNTFTLSPFYVSGQYVGHKLQSNPAPTVIDVALNNDSTVGFFDNNGVFNTGTYRYTCSASGVYTLKAFGKILWNWQNVVSVFQVDVPGFNMLNQIGQIQFEVYDYTNNVVVTNCLAQWAPDQPMPNSSAIPVAGYNDLAIPPTSVQLTAGNQYGVRVRVVTLPEKQFWLTIGANEYASDITINYGIFGNSPFTASFENQVTNTNLQLGDTVNMNSILPKMKCTEFLSNIIKMFNLMVDRDKTNERKYIIETRDDYYAQGVDIDWTNKLDVSQPIEEVPCGEVAAKRYNYKYKQDGDFYNKDHETLYGSVYGNRKLDIDNDYLKAQYDTEVTFSPTVLAQDYPFRVTSNMKKDSDTDAQTAFTGNPRILIFNMASVAYGGWTHTENFDQPNGIFYQQYPYAGHLDKPLAPYFDLNWDYPKGVYFPYDAWTDRNIWNLYHKRSMEELTDRDGRVIRCYMHLTSRDIFQLDFRNRFIIDGCVFRLNRVIDFLVNRNIPVKCEFVKALDKPPFTPTLIWFDPGVTVTGFGNTLPGIANQGNGSNQGGGRTGVIDQGTGNRIGGGAYAINVNGNGNNIGAFSYNITVSGNNNVVYPSLENVTIINSDGLTVTESNKVYLNGEDVTNMQAKILRIST
jgi:hypothetical protein